MKKVIGFYALKQVFLVNRRLSRLILTGIFMVFLTSNLMWAQQLPPEELPPPTVENCFYMMPLWESFRIPSHVSFEEKFIQIEKMKQQLGQGNIYHRLGFGAIYASGGSINVWRENARLAQQAKIHLGAIFALQSHSRQVFRDAVSHDSRYFQWRIDGQDWKGSFTSSGDLEIPEDQRDYMIPTPSRLATTARNYNEEQIRIWARQIMQLMEEFPGVIAWINGPIEEELAVGGHRDNTKLADYSPFAITEFRDWLRHTGIYDATSGKYKGEGALAPIIGNLIQINGELRSQFYDDPTPANANGTGISFNQYFGTNFTTWDLRYWDMNKFPSPITNENFNPTPQSGSGFTAGGFDAPRNINPNSPFWKAWSYDIPDQGGSYPAGNPTAPAFGFRQNMVRNFIRDLFDILADEGLPREIMYAHQIPGELLGNFTGAAGRNRSSASTIWSGYLEKSGTVGITRFGRIPMPQHVAQYAPRWGIFEWHTWPNKDRNSQELYDRTWEQVTSFYNNGAHILTPGWWSVGRTDDKFNIFPTDDSKFIDALGDFIKTTPNRPYWQKNANVNYTPPKVWGVNAFLSKDNELSIFWENLIWPGHRTSWREWEYFKGYELSTSTDGSNWDTEHTLYNLAFRDVNAENPFHIRVRAEKTDGVFGPWSEVYTFEPLSGSTKLTLISERNPASARADLVNLITIEPEQGGPFLEGNPYGTLSITQNHANVTTELHNPDMPGSGLVRMSINDASSFATGNAQIVTLTAPEGAFLEGIEFDYHSNYQKDKMTLVMLDDQDQIIWENNNSGVTSGNKTHGFASPVSSISFAINIKQPGTIASGSFVSISGIRSFYSPGSIFPVPNIDLSLSGDGIPCNTRPNNIESIEKFWSMDDAGQVYNVMNCTNVVFENGYFSATSATHDPYFTFTQSAIDGTQLKHIAFRLYSSKAGTAQLFHFSSDGPRRQDFPIQEGWHVYHLMGTDHWQAQTEITSVRLDPNIEAGVHFKLDWFAISSQPVSDLIVPDFTMTPDNKVQVAIAGSGVEGEYTLTATHHGNANPITVQTLLNPPTNIKPLQVDKKEEAIIAYPNPFHSEVNFSINLKSNELVKLEVYDFSGRKVASLKNEIMVQGEHILTWKPEYNFRAGIYIYMLEVGGMVYPGKILYKGRN